MKRILIVSLASVAGAFFLTAFASTAGIRLPFPAARAQTAKDIPVTEPATPPPGCGAHAEAAHAKSAAADGCCAKKPAATPATKEGTDACCKK